jgi:hypothetical protein
VYNCYTKAVRDKIKIYVLKLRPHSFINICNQEPQSILIEKFKGEDKFIADVIIVRQSSSFKAIWSGPLLATTTLWFLDHWTKHKIK